MKVVHRSGVTPADGIELPRTLGARLRRARGRRFVGRAAELELFRSALESPDPPWAVLFLHGPGGVGKTALLHALGDAAEQAGVAASRVDLRGVEPSPPGFLSAVASAVGCGDADAALHALRGDVRRVLLLDTYESVAPIDTWIRERFLPELGERVLVVLAGREPPDAAWAQDPGWRELLRAVSLRNLSPDDARDLLRAHGVAEGLHACALGVTHGHPLALSLLVDVLATAHGAAEAPVVDLADSPDLVRVLLERFLAQMPSERHRRALAVCAHARVTTEARVRAACDGDDAAELFAWLRSLSFVEEGREGVFPHDLARDVLEADLRWRDRGAYADVHHGVRRHVVAHIRATSGREQQRAVADLHWLHRGNPGIRPFYDWSTLGQGYADVLRPGDEEAVIELVGRYEPPESVELVRFWLARQPDAFVMCRTAGRPEPFGFLARLALHEASEADLARDPGAASMWAYALAHGAPRPGEEVHAGRFYIDAEAYQAPSPTFNVAAINSVQHWFSHPRLAWDFIGGWSDPDAIAPFMRHIDYHRAPEADFEVGGRRHGVFAHDWRRTPVEPWLDLMSEREIAEEPAGGAQADAPPVLALSREEFADAARRALQDLHRPEALARNPLARTRAVRDRGDGEAPAEVVEALLREAVAALASDPRGEKLHRAVDRAYVHAAPTQERAAEVLGVPLSSFRRHLARGTERVIAWLWERELYGRE
jgi:AAA ATPase domain